MEKIATTPATRKTTTQSPRRDLGLAPIQAPGLSWIPTRIFHLDPTGPRAIARCVDVSHDGFSGAGTRRPPERGRHANTRMPAKASGMSIAGRYELTESAARMYRPIAGNRAHARPRKTPTPAKAHTTDTATNRPTDAHGLEPSGTPSVKSRGIGAVSNAMPATATKNAPVILTSTELCCTRRERLSVRSTEGLPIAVRSATTRGVDTSGRRLSHLHACFALRQLILRTKVDRGDDPAFDVGVPDALR